MYGRTEIGLLLLAALAGCDAPTPPAKPRADAGRLFDPRQCGQIQGTVRWSGPAPAVRPFRSIEQPLLDQNPPAPPREWPNPNAPRLDPATGGLGSAVVFLEGVDVRRARPWDHPPARVELRDFSLRVVQGDSDGRVGFVRGGGRVDLVSRQRVYHCVQGRGDAFFALTLPRPEEVRSRTLSTRGVVELRSGVGHFWMRGYLFVDHHPYYARPEADGSFTLREVPAGEYTLVAWHPDWHLVREERNPDSFRVQQVQFAPPLRVTRTVRVEAGKTAQVDLELGASR